TTATVQPRATARTITPHAADDFPFPLPVLRRTSDRVRSGAIGEHGAVAGHDDPAGAGRGAEEVAHPADLIGELLLAGGRVEGEQLPARVGDVPHEAVGLDGRPVA